MLSSGSSNALNLARWLSAFFVVISHIRPLLFVEYDDVVQKGIFTFLIYFFTGFGREAVVIFFVVSGFLVGGRSVEKAKDGKFSFLEYYVSRFSRIYTVLVPVLLLGGFLDYIGFRYFNQSKIYTEAASYGIDSIGVIYNRLEPSVFLGNLLMLQNIAVPIYGTNGPLWSLAFEWWYYMAFALCLWAFQYRSLYLQVSVVVIVLSSLAYLSTGLILGAALWLVGVYARLALSRPVQRPLPWLYLVLLGVALLFSRAMAIKHDFGFESHALTLLKQVLIATSFSAWLVHANEAYGRFTAGLYLSKYLADFSYTLYLLHFPVLVFLVALFFSVGGVEFRTQPGLFSLLYFVAILLAVYVSSLIFSLIVEKRSPAVRAFLLRLFGHKTGSVM